MDQVNHSGNHEDDQAESHQKAEENIQNINVERSEIIHHENHSQEHKENNDIEEKNNLLANNDEKLKAESEEGKENIVEEGGYAIGEENKINIKNDLNLSCEDKKNVHISEIKNGLQNHEEELNEKIQNSHEGESNGKINGEVNLNEIDQKNVDKVESVLDGFKNTNNSSDAQNQQSAELNKNEVSNILKSDVTENEKINNQRSQIDAALKESLDSAINLKKTANNLFQEKNYQGALMTYNNALTILKFDTKATPALFKELLSCKKSILNNMSQCYINLKLWPEALELSNNVLRIDDNDMKAYYRAALSLKNLDQFDDALSILNNGQRKNQDQVSKEYMNLKKEIVLLIKQRDKDDKDLYSKMLGEQPPKNTPMAESSIMQNKHGVNWDKIKYLVALAFSSSGGFLFYQYFINKTELSSARKMGIAAGFAGNIFALFSISNKWWRCILIGTATGMLCATIKYVKMNSKQFIFSN